MRIFHISDLHIRSDNKHNFQVESKLVKLEKELTSLDLVVCTGDITDDGTETQYANALKILTPFTGRIILTPGNHDYGAAGLIYKKECVKRFKVFKSLLEHPKRDFYALRILDLDSNLRTSTPLDFARGEVGWWDRRKIKKFGLDCKANKLISLVCLHHTPFEEHWALQLKDQHEFLRACEGYVDYVLVGHEHKQRLINFSKEGTQAWTTYYSAPSLAHEKAQPVVINIDFLNKA